MALALPPDRAKRPLLLFALLGFANVLFGFAPKSNYRNRHVGASSRRTPHRRRSSFASPSAGAGTADERGDAPPPPSPLHVAVVGAGPSGALLAHLLLRRHAHARVTLLEGRPDPRGSGSGRDAGEGRAYALGIGIRGRTAIRDCDEDLWSAVRARGYESERFQLHVGGLAIPLRDGDGDGDGGGGDGGVEPSLLIFQSQLCATLIDELERRHGSASGIDGDGTARLRLLFDAPVDGCDADAMTLVSHSQSAEETRLGPFDLVVGCDGVNSVVRSAMRDAHPGFEARRRRLPGEFKVVRLNAAPPRVDPAAVSLLLPKSGSCSAFVEPTGNGTYCILFASRGEGDNPILSETSNVTAVVEALAGAFPQWGGDVHAALAKQLVLCKAGTASSVVCNTYHVGGRLVLVGDAAHATGGVSGQGVNSALTDASVLARCLGEHPHSLPAALLSYSQRQVPEGKALYDLSFGPSPRGVRGVRFACRTLRDALFRGRFGVGRPPLQTRLTTERIPFADLRRELDEFYEEAFLSPEEFDRALAALHEATAEADPRTTSSMAMPFERT